MQRLVPVWLLALCLLVGTILAVLFAWGVKGALGNRYGQLGKDAVAVASFPDKVKLVLHQVEADPDESFRVPTTGTDLSQFQPLKARAGIDVKGPVARADQVALARAQGWRVLVGGFVVDGEFSQAALVLSPELEIVKVMKFPEKDIPGQVPVLPFRKLVHGFALLKDGSAIVTYDDGVSLQRFDVCGKRLWATPGDFEHSVSLVDGEEFAWALRDESVDGKLINATVVKVATATGKVVRRITMDDVVAANPALHVFDIRGKDDNFANGNPRNTTEDRLEDPFHLNDVEPLPAAIAGRFPGFKAGDLLISARSLNLIFVMDPETLQVKWWRIGATRRQHDPDWQPNGEITVFDNRMSLDYSQIMGIDPATQRTRIVLDGRSNDFYSRIRGKHQIIPNGNLLIASPQQGRVFEVEPDGHVVLEIYNRKYGSDKFNYPMSDAQWLPSDAFDFAGRLSCAK